MPAYEKKKLERKWWMEEGEEPVVRSTKRMTEAYATRDNNHFQPGWDGRNPPSVTQSTEKSTGYSSLPNQDKLGKGGAGAKAHSKGEADKAIPTVKEQKRTVKSFYEDEFGNEDEYEDNDEGLEDEGDFGDEGFEDEDMGGDDFGDEGLEGDEDFGDEEDIAGVADDVEVIIDGQTFSLTPNEEDSFEGEGDEFEDEEGLGDEGMEDGDMDDLGGVGGEDEDVTHPMEAKKRVAGKVLKEGKKVSYDKIINSALKEGKKKVSVKRLAKYYIEMRKHADKKLYELFTGEYVLNKTGETGFDFTEVGGEKDFAVVARAAEGDQYSPTISQSVYEPDKSHKGGKTQHAKVVKENYRNWLRNVLSESEDAGLDSENFNKNDTLGNNLKGDPATKFPGIPEEKGEEEDTITGHNLSQGKKGSSNPETPTNESVRKNRLARKTENSKVTYPSKEVEDDLLQGLKESKAKKFDFGSWKNGEY